MVNREGPDQMTCSAALELGLHYLHNVPKMGFRAKNPVSELVISIA